MLLNPDSPGMALSTLSLDLATRGLFSVRVEQRDVQNIREVFSCFVGFFFVRLKGGDVNGLIILKPERDKPGRTVTCGSVLLPRADSDTLQLIKCANCPMGRKEKSFFAGVHAAV